MKNKLFRVTFDTERTKNQIEYKGVMTENFFIKKEPAELCVGGRLLFHPVAYEVNVVDVVPVGYILLGQHRLYLNKNIVRLLMFLQQAAFNILKNIIIYNKVNIDDAETALYFKLAVNKTSASATDNRILISVEPGGYLNSYEGTTLMAAGIFAIETHLCLFVTEVIRVTETFKKTIMEYDEKMKQESGDQELKQEADLTDRYFTGKLNQDELSRLEYPWYNLEKLFSEYLTKNNLTKEDVEKIIHEEEEKWQRENPDKTLATEVVNVLE